MKTKSGVSPKREGKGRLVAATHGKSLASGAKLGTGLATLLLGIALFLVACAPETGAPAEANVGESEAKLSTAGMHGFMLSSDADNTLAVTAVGAVHGTTLKLFKGCTWENPECTWSYINGMIVSDADPTLAINAWGGAADGTVLRLSNACTTSNTSCTWTYSQGEFLSDANTSLAINAWGGATAGSTLKITSLCTTSNTSCTWTMHRAMLFSNTGTSLAWNAWGGATEGASVRLSDICSRTNTSCTWTVKKGNIISDANSGLGVIGGSTNLSPLQTTGWCAPPSTSTICTWTFKHGEIVSDAGSTLVVNAVGGASAGAYLKVNTACTATNTSCLFSATIGGPQCVGGLEPSCPAAPAAPTVTQDTAIGNILASAASMAATADKPVALAAAVVVNGHIYYNVWGNRKFGVVSPVQPNDRFSIGSITKTMTGEWLARAVDAGIMSYGTTVISQLPTLFSSPSSNPYQFDTLEQLLAHQGGFLYQPLTGPVDHTYIPGLPLRRIAYTQDALIDSRSYAGSTGVEIYCGSPVTAVAMYETNTGAAYEERMQHDLFGPLDMQGASFDALSASGSVTGVWNHSGTAPSLTPITPADQHVERSPVGGVGASAVDMGKYLNYALTSHPAVRYSVGRGKFTPLGWQEDVLDEAGGLRFIHTGSLNTDFSWAEIWPARGVAFFVATNSDNQNVIASVLNRLKTQVETGSPSWGAPAIVFPQTSSPTFNDRASASASSTASGSAAVNAFDGNYTTAWQAPTGVSNPFSLMASFNGPETVSGAVINEWGVPDRVSAPLGANSYRVQSYNLWLWSSATSSWILASSGTAIGPNKVISFGTTYSNITKTQLDLSTDLTIGPPRIGEFHLTP